MIKTSTGLFTKIAQTMKHDLANNNISCPLFKTHQSIILSKKSGISNSARPIEKSIFAEEIMETTDNMQDCEKFDHHNLDCNTCHAIAKIQRKLAESHIEVKKTA
jgi:hypothetical protein